MSFWIPLFTILVAIVICVCFLLVNPINASRKRKNFLYTNRVDSHINNQNTGLDSNEYCSVISGSGISYIGWKEKRQ